MLPPSSRFSPIQTRATHLVRLNGDSATCKLTAGKFSIPSTSLLDLTFHRVSPLRRTVLSSCMKPPRLSISGGVSNMSDVAPSSESGHGCGGLQLVRETVMTRKPDFIGRSCDGLLVHRSMGHHAQPWLHCVCT